MMFQNSGYWFTEANITFILTVLIVPLLIFVGIFFIANSRTIKIICAFVAVLFMIFISTFLVKCYLTASSIVKSEWIFISPNKQEISGKTYRYFDHHSYPKGNGVLVDYAPTEVDTFDGGIGDSEECYIQAQYGNEQLAISLIDSTTAEVYLNKYSNGHWVSAHGHWTDGGDSKVIYDLKDSGVYGIRGREMDWVNSQYAKFEKLLGLTIPRDCNIITDSKLYDARKPDQLETKWLFISSKGEKIFGTTYRDGHYDADRDDISVGPENDGISIDYYPYSTKAFDSSDMPVCFVQAKSGQKRITMKIIQEETHIRVSTEVRWEQYIYYGNGVMIKPGLPFDESNTDVEWLKRNQDEIKWLSLQHAKFEKLLGISIPMGCNMIINHHYKN